MKLNRSAIYTIHACIHIARHGRYKHVGGPEVAKALNQSVTYMRWLLAPVTRAGILVGIKGPNGGYRLARPAKSITLLEIIEAAGGDLDVPRVGIKNEELSTAFALVAAAERRVLAGVTLADLASNGR